jgi:hypothetical protein
MTVRANNTHIIFDDATVQNAAPATAINVATTGSSLIPFYPTGIPWQVNTAIHVANGRHQIVGDVVKGLFLSNTGHRAYSIGDTTDRVREYALSTNYQINTASHDTNANVSVSAQDTLPTGLFFNPDGTRMFIVGTSSDRAWQYELSTPWQVNTATHTAGANVSVASQDATPQSVFFNNVGSKMYITGTTTGKVYEYDLSTNWQVNTATHTSTANLTPATILSSTLKAGRFSSNGHKLYLSVANSITQIGAIRQYNCSTPYRINNATLEVVYSIIPLHANGAASGTVGVGLDGLFFHPDGTTMFTSFSNTMMEFDMSPQTLRIKTVAIFGVNSTSNATHVIIS